MSKHPLGPEAPSLVPCPPARTTTASSPLGRRREAPLPPRGRQLLRVRHRPSRETTRFQGSQPALRAAVGVVEAGGGALPFSSAPSAAESATASGEIDRATSAHPARALRLL